MNVPSLEFLAFAAVIAVAINVSRAAGWRRVVLLTANTAFLWSFARDPRQLAPIVALLALGFAGVKWMELSKRRAFFSILIGALLLAFFWLKHYTFVPPSLFLPYAYTTIGMSYVFFRILHLIIDAYQDSLPERVDLASYVNYTLNFTSLVSGPIQLYSDYRRAESGAGPPLDASAMGSALRRVIDGFFKVSVVSPVLLFAHGYCVVAVASSTSGGQRTAYAALLLALFPMYLYINFSGYMDFVIGVARFIRLELPENFDRPFSSRGFIELWSRWHITLSNWLKTYVYSPLLLALMHRYPAPKMQPLLGVFAYFVTFFLVGAWHGQTSMFLFFGVLQGLGVSVNKLYQIVMTRRLGRVGYRNLCADPAYASASRGLTFSYFAVTLLWFWSTWAQLAHLAKTLGPTAAVAAVVLVIVGAAFALSAIYAVESRLSSRTSESAGVARGYLTTAWYTALAVITISVTAVLNAPAPHIVYKAF